MTYVTGIVHVTEIVHVTGIAQVSFRSAATTPVMVLQVMRRRTRT